MRNLLQQYIQLQNCLHVPASPDNFPLLMLSSHVEIGSL